VAGTSGDRIAISADWVKAHPDDFGMVIHELTHVVQGYPKYDPVWLVEGIADYVRYWHFEPGRKPRVEPKKRSYREGYGTAAAFLAWMEKTHDKEIVPKLNRALRAGTYRDELLKEYTGKGLDELWRDFCNVAEKAGGAAPAVQVVTLYPGMPADAVEKTITNRIERWVNQAPALRRVESHTVAGVSIVRAYFEKGTDPDTALTGVNSLALAAPPNLPANTVPPLVIPLGPENQGPLGLLAVEGPNLNEAQLKDVARIDVRGRLLTIPGCVAPVVFGGKDRAVVVYLDPKKLEAHKLTPMGVVDALRKARAKLGLGIACFVDNQVVLEAGKALKDVAELNDLPLRDKPGEEVILRDVAHVADAYAPPTALVRIDGRRGVVIPVYRQAGAARGTVRERLAKALPGMEPALPKGARLRWVSFGGQAGAEDTGLVTLLVRAPSDLRLEAAERRVAAVEDLLRANVPADERTAIVSELGVGKGLETAFTRNDGPQDATIYLRLADSRRHTARQYVEKLRGLFRKEPKLADLSVRFEADGRGGPLAVVIRGGQPEAAARLAVAVRRRVAAVRGAADVTVLERVDAPTLVIEADRRKAAAVGLSAQDVLRQAIAAVGNPFPPADSFWLEPKTGDRSSITVPYPQGGKSLEDVLSAPALSANAPVRLSSLLTLRRATTAVEIDHTELQRVFRVTVDVEGREVRDVAADIRKTLKELPVPEPMKVEVEVQGQRTSP
jgi:multidrug efflux pump subunit AcrB